MNKQKISMYRYNAQLVLKKKDIYDCIIIKSNTKLNIKSGSSFNVCDSLKLTKREANCTQLP